MDCSQLGSSVHAIPRQEYQSGLLFPPPGTGLVSPALAGGFYIGDAPNIVGASFNPKLLVYLPLATPAGPSGNHKFVFYVCESVSVL